VKADISEIAPRFPALRIAFVVATSIRAAAEASPALQQRRRETEQALQSRFTLDGVAQIPEIRAWREAYKAFGVKKTSYRSSVERLLRRVLQGRGLPSVSPFVDAYNEVSARFLLPLGADDLDRIDGDLFFRVGRTDDSFVPLGGGDDAEAEPPKPGEIVYADGAKILCRRWNWYQDARSPVGPDTTRAVLTVQYLGAGDLEAAVAALCAALQQECGARTEVAIASMANPVVALAV
jgi:DNA/RNA-binding domain of Phe-tRNA-synthetase-like protein